MSQSVRNGQNRSKLTKNDGFQKFMSKIKLFSKF